MKSRPTVRKAAIDNTATNDNTTACGISCKTHSADLSQQPYFSHQNYHVMSEETVSKQAALQAETSQAKFAIYQRATQRIIDLLEKGEVAWRRTWGTYGFAKNFKTGHVYTGINFLMMNFGTEHTVPYYLTYRQVTELGGHVKKGAKAQYVFFYKGCFKDKDGKYIPEKDAELPKYANTDLEPFRVLRSYPVFNIEDTRGIEWKRPEEVNRPNEPIAECEAIIAGINPQPTFQQADTHRAFYDPLSDVINVPHIAQFENSAFFYRTAFHEIAHWSGAAGRLNRVGITELTKFGSERYAEEELIAELTSNFLLNIAGAATNDSMNVSAGYLQSWISRLQEDPKMLFRVVPKAQEATEYILGRSFIEFAA
ncbi:MAG: DUF1738 domain-containing protein [Bacteroidetes bacterium]|nr:DUF1738 domain-containing protein [Bacteroidota bacterium]